MMRSNKLSLTRVSAHAAALLAGAAMVSSPLIAQAQNPFDPPTATKPPPNVMLLLDGTRTTLINGANCRGICHVEGTSDAECGGHGGEYDCNIYREGETRLQLARRVLTGGWGWNTNYVSSTNGPADARIRADGVMDQYRVRWGVAYFDGLGTRLVTDPTTDSDVAQRAVIDFGHPSNEHLMPPSSRALPALNSWFPYARTRLTRGAAWENEANRHGCYTTGCDPSTARDDSNARQSQALQYIHDYWHIGRSPGAFTLGPNAAAARAPDGTTPLFHPGAVPRDSDVIDRDPANVLVSPGTAGCRRNFTIMLMDGHGGGRRESSQLYTYNGLTSPEAAGRIVDLGGATVRNDPEKRNQVFAIRFGLGELDALTSSNGIADYGFDGAAGGGGIATAFEAAPGGVIADLTAMYAAFAAIFSLVFDGDYNGAAPVVTRYGDRMARTQFTIQDCAGVSPTLCNIGRPGSLEWFTLNADGSIGLRLFNAGEGLRSHLFSARNIFSTPPVGYTGYASETNCGPLATCSSRILNTRRVSGTDVAFSSSPLAVPMSVPDPLVLGSLTLGGSDIDFLRGDPNARFANGVRRGDTNGDDAVDHPYKLMDIANSQPVVVGAPSGIGEDIERWNAFLGVPILRTSSMNGDGSNTTVRFRDQVIYVGGNDGMLHAFLAARNSGTRPSRDTGRIADYENLPPCNTDVGTTQYDHGYCGGSELWAYAPRMLQRYWRSIRGGHYYMVDGSPVVQDVLFTKGSANPGTVCTSYNQAGCGWEYRTVLVQCLGGGGPGCFAMDVTNPFADPPRVLWEREMSAVTGRGTSTSRPQIARVRRTIGGVSTPYYVALMGGGLNESRAGSKKGTFIAIGLEDGDTFFTPTSAPADFAGAPTCLDTDFDSFVDTCYITTTTAEVWKIRLENGEPSRMTMGKFFDGRMAAGSSSIRSYARVVATFDVDKRLNLFYGTGNFEDPQSASEQNYLFKFRDLAPDEAPSWSAALNVARMADSCAGARDGTFPDADGTSGVLPLQAGEKILFDPVIASGTVFFTSYAPDSNPCLPGSGYLYGINHDSCSVGIDTNGDGLADEDRIGGISGLPAAPTVNEEAGTVIVSTDRGDPNPVAARTPPSFQVPLLKLWWRRIAF